MEDHKHVTILLVEDDPGHAVLIEKNLRRANISNSIITLGDGRKAVDFLFKEGVPGGDHPMPLLILLDLNLPVLDGYQVLKVIKSDERTKRIPVVVLTTTDNPTRWPGATNWDATYTSRSRWSMRSFPTPSGRSGCSSSL